MHIPAFGSATEHLGMCTLLSPFCEVSKISTAFQTMDTPENDVVQAFTSSLPAVDVDDVKFEKLSLKEATVATKIEFTQEELKICTEVAKALRKSKSEGGWFKSEPNTSQRSCIDHSN